MKRKLQNRIRPGLALTGAALLLALSACAPTASPTPTPSAGPDPNAHALGLTAEQRLEDYEYFWATLRDSYPCWGILEREGFDLEALYRDYRELVTENDSDISFYSAIYSTLFRLGGKGHLWIVEPEDYRDSRAYMENYGGTDRVRWGELLLNPDTAAKYDALSAMLQDGDEDSGGGTGETPADNVSTLLLPGQGAAYVKINSFAGDKMEVDGKVLSGFYQQLQGYSDLIIDLTENSGGSELYWQNLLVAPNINAPLSCENYALTRMSENNRPYLENVFPPEELRPIGELPDLPNLAPEDRALATHFVRSTLSVTPAEHRSPFRGRVWLLVSDRVYSASESFSVFCQQTGFATLVGTRTGGDGIGALNPIFLQLPNSGILVQFTAMFGLNPDGGSNEEFGTTPDLPSPAGETPLVTALRAVQTAQEKG